MKINTIFATVFIAACAICTGASAQKVYKCGASYSQTPCPDAVTIHAEDTRSQAQQMDSKKVIARDVAAANAAEKARLKEEKIAAKQGQSDALKDQNSKSKGKEKSDSKEKKKTSKKNGAEFFTATPPGGK